MKIKHLLIGMLAMAASVACKQDEPVETPKLDVDKTAVSLAATAGEASFNVTSNQSWVASADADWVSLEPASGAASEKAVAVKVTAEDNETTEARKATVTVKAGELTKTVEVNQAAGAGDQPGPGPDLPQSEWALVGTFGESNNWNAASDLYLSVLDEEYFVYYGIELTATTEFKFLKGGAWPPAGQEIGGNGLVEPNTIQPAGGSNIKVTEAGKYDIYLAADLTKFYIMSEGKLPSEAVEPAPVENQWSMMGCFVDNQWSTDVPMTKEGEWIVAKGAQFTELTFKIRANASWADATNIGRAPGSERAVVNGRIEVVTAEYAKANLGGDAADIKLNGEAGTYDVYFSFENLEVYVMEEGFKPGEKEPQNPDPVEITYTVVGTITENVWSNNAEIGLMAKEGDYLVAKNVPFVWNSTCYGGNYNIIEFKIVETGTWDGYGVAAGTAAQSANAEIALIAGGDNIPVVAAEGAYDVYFDKANAKVWVMNAGLKPGDTPAPEDPSDPAVKETIWEGEPFDLGSDWSQGLQITSVPRLPEDARIHVVYEAPAGYDYYQFKFCYISQDWNWNALTSPPGATDGCVVLDPSATEYSFALNADDIAAINSGRGMVVQGYAAIIKMVYFTSDIEVGDGPKLIWEGRCELLSDWSSALQIQNMPLLESGVTIYVEYEAAGYDYYQFKFCYIDESWGWNVMTSPVDVNEYDCVMLDPDKTEYVLALNDDDIAAINAGKGMVIQGYGAVITKVSYK